MNRLLVGALVVGSVAWVRAADYLVAVPAGAAAEPAWAAVADVLAARHGAERVEWPGDGAGLLPILRARQPRWLAVVGRPQDFDAALVRALNRVSRQLDGDPWADVRWGLITGPTVADAERIAKTADPLVIERALTTTGIDLGLVKSGLTISDGAKGNWHRKEADGTSVDGAWDEAAEPGGTVGMFAKYWNEARPQLLVSSSHATQFNLEMPWGLGLIASRGGRFHVLERRQVPEFARFLGGAMFTGDPQQLGRWLDGLKAPVLDPQPEVPKVWVAAGNCLIGDARGSADSMVATAAANGVRQLVGYVVPTWFGRAGWGTLGLWQAHRGELSLADAFHLNQQKIIAETIRRFPRALEVTFDSDDIQGALSGPTEFVRGLRKLEAEGVKPEQDLLGLVHDRDVVALWGDPKWAATFAPEKRRPLTLAWHDGEGGQVLTLTATDQFRGELAAWLPRRVAGATTARRPDGGALPAGLVAADDFVLVPELVLGKGETLTLVIAPAA